jgi:AcrR family transcriptional regulator
MNGYERRKEQTKENIRQAALELFKAHGVKRVSVSDIASRAAVSPVTIYNHFRSKDDLVRDVAKQFVLSLVDKYQAVMQGDASFMEKLEWIIFDKMEIGRQYSAEFLQTIISNDPELQEFVTSIFENRVYRLMSDYFQEGKRQGHVNPDLSDETMILYTRIFRLGVTSYPGLFEAAEQNENLFPQLSYLYLYGIMGRRDEAARTTGGGKE